MAVLFWIFGAIVVAVLVALIVVGAAAILKPRA